MSVQQEAKPTAADFAKKEEQKKRLREHMRRIGQKFVVLSGKGGVGKSTVAANLAVALASGGRKVGLLDVDVHGPSIPRLMGLEGRWPGSNGSEMTPVQVNDSFSVMSVGFLIEREADAVIWRGPIKFGIIRQFLSDVDWGDLDYLVIDCPPGTGDEPLSVAQLVGRPAAAVVVTTPQQLAIGDVRRCVTFCEKVELPVAGIIENMSGFVCPQCGAAVDLFGKGGGEKLAEEMSVPFLGKVPIDPEIVNNGDSGAPFVEAGGERPSARAFLDMVAAIEDFGKPAEAGPVQEARP